MDDSININILPVLPLRGVVVVPYMILNLDVGRTYSIKALETAMLQEKKIALITQRSVVEENPLESGLFNIGVLAEIKQVVKMSNGSWRVLVEGIQRINVVELITGGDYIKVAYEPVFMIAHNELETEALAKVVMDSFENWIKLSNKVAPEILVTAKTIAVPSRLADFIIGNLPITVGEKQELLEEIVIDNVLLRLAKILNRENELLEVAKKISQRVKSQVDKNQKEYYLKEQLKAINKELSDTDGLASEIRSEYADKMKKKKIPEFVLERINKEISRLEKMPVVHMEGSVIRNYLDTLINIPWSAESKDNLDLDKSEEILEEDHYGLEKVKERILEYLAVKILTKSLKGPILCLVGPPGVGKTSLAKSIARSMNRKFVRASLGGVRDEAEIRGHRRTYIGAMPGRIIQSLITCKTKNPVFLLDEIDKMSNDFRGDPSSAMLEVLDPEQNNTFQDHYVDLPYDLSKVFWVITANDAGRIPAPLRDRMEIIHLSSYTEEEKINICQKYLIPKKISEHGLTDKQVTFSSGVISNIIHDYTKEAGVRSLERSIAKICRKVARSIAQKNLQAVHITAVNLHKFLGNVIYNNKDKVKKEQPGLVNGLAWTNFGGDVLNVEVLATPGKGELLLTGQLGDVMVESAKAAYSYLRANIKTLELPKEFPGKIDIHVHFPAGATPKDGPSAGVTMVIALLSALKGKSVSQNIAMTGEVTLLGRVLAVGGIKEKVLAAHRYGVRKIFIPAANEGDLQDIPAKIRKQLQFVLVDNVIAVINEVFGGEQES